MTEKAYARLVKEMMPKSPIKKNCFHAFWVGGTICLLGQLFIMGWQKLGLPREDAAPPLP